VPGADPSGTNDSTAAIDVLIGAAGPTIYLAPGTYKFSSKIVLASGQCIDGGSSGAVTLQWAGGNGGDLVATSTSAVTNFPCLKGVTIDAGSATNVNLLHVSDGSQGSFEDIVLNAENGSANTCRLITAGDSGTGAAHNSALHNFKHVRGTGCQTGTTFQGIASGPTVVTDNVFTNDELEGSSNAAGVMYNFVAWADTNNFYHARASLGPSNSTGVVCNSGTPASNVGVYDNNFYYLDVDAFGSVSGQTGITINWCKQFGVYGLYQSPDTFPGTLINATSNAQSYYINQNGAPPTITSLNYNEVKLGNPGYTVGQLSLGNGAAFQTHLNVDVSSDFSILDDLALFEMNAGGSLSFTSNSNPVFDYGFTNSGKYTLSVPAVFTDLPTSGTGAGYGCLDGSGNFLNLTTPCVDAGGGAISYIPLTTGPLVAISGTAFGFTKIKNASTLVNVVASALSFTCSGNPTITIYECGTSATCSGGTLMASATLTAAGTAVNPSLSSTAIAAGHYIAADITGGTCTNLNATIVAGVQQS
jgi:hypothetical protein